MLREVEASCPGCQAQVHFDVEVPDTHIQIVEDISAVEQLANDLSKSQQSAEALRGDLRRWQSGENHLQGEDMLRMLQNCPNCRPVLAAFAEEIKKQTLFSLTPVQVKEIARRQKWWPPPPIKIVQGPTTRS